MLWIPQTVGLTQGLDSGPSCVLRLFLALVFLSRACLSHSAPWLWTGFSQIHRQCPWQTVASHWPQTDFCHFLPPSVGCLGLRLNSRVLKGRMLSAQRSGAHPWSVAMLASVALVAPGRAVWREEMLSTRALTPCRSMTGASGVIRR